MLKRVPAKRLKPGMYVVQYGDGSFQSPLVRAHLLIQSQQDIDSIVSEAGSVIIDTRRGLDLITPSAAVTGTGLASIPPMLEAGELGPEPMVSLAEEMVFARKAYNRALDFMSRLLRDVRAGNMSSMSEAEPLAQEISESSRRNNRAAAALPILRSHGYVTHHSVNVAFLAAAFGRHLGLAELEVEVMTLAGLLHDLGKAKLPDSILHKPGKVTANEMVLVRRHQVEGCAMLQNQGLPATVLRAVLEHHERWDGSGYPRGLKGDAAALLSRRLSILDVYDALISYRTYRKALSPYKALRQLYTNSGRLYCAESVAAFIRFIGIYPVGSFVRLSDGTCGVVTAFSSDKPLLPTVKVVLDNRMRPIRQKSVNVLAEQGGIGVTGSLNPKEYRIDADLFFP